jgi:glycosyltransferase involved in cell wall biosynthesis
VTKPRLLYLCGQSPWLCNGGSLLRNYWMIRALSSRFAIDLVTSSEPEEPMPGSFAALLDQYACFPREPRTSSGFGRIAQAARRGESSLTAGWVTPAMRDYVADRLGRYPYAAIQADLPMQAALPHRDTIPIVYNAHNCESELLRRRAANEPPHLALPIAIDAVRVRRIEGALVARSRLVAACAELDIRDFEQFCPNVRAKAAVVPNGVNVEGYAAVRDAKPDPDTILITGSMDWRPNLLGLHWFLRESLPHLRGCAPNLKIRIAGRMHPSLVRDLEKYANVEAVPNPASMEKHLAEASVIAAPIVASSGTRLRILEAWAAGRPVVTTRPGASGLEYEEGRELIVRDNAKEFAEAIARVASVRPLADWLVENALARIGRYDWGTIGEGLLESYERVVSAPPQRRVPTVSEEIAGGVRA